MRHAFLNGRVVPEAEARIPVDDRAVLFADAAYETLRTYGGTIFRFPEHLRRLHETLDAMGLVLPWSDDEITVGTRALIEAEGHAESRIRITVTGGRHDGAIRLKRGHPPNLIVTAEALVPPPPAAYRDGVDVRISPETVPDNSPLARIKTVVRLAHLMAKEEAIAHGAWDSLFLDDHGLLLEGTATNIFLVVDGVLTTPSLDCAILAGVTRDLVIEVARSEGVPLHEGRIPRLAIAAASEAFLTSTTIELLPVRAIEGRPVGDGKPGPVRAKLHRAYRRVAAAETGAVLDEP